MEKERKVAGRPESLARNQRDMIEGEKYWRDSNVVKYFRSIIIYHIIYFYYKIFIYKILNTLNEERLT